MADDSIEKQLLSFFPEVRRGDWEKIAVQETNGKDPFQALSWRGKDGINFLPYYDAHDTAGLTCPVPAESLQRARHWLNLPAIHVGNDVAANKVARQHLTGGANGIFFYLNQQKISAVEILTSDIDLSTCNVFLRFAEEQTFHDTFFSNTANSVLNRIDGALFWENIPKTGRISECLSRSANFRGLGIVVSPSSPAQEIAHALLKGVQAYERFHAGANSAQVFRSIAFSITADVLFLESVAKIKALRSLWFQIARAYGQVDYQATDLHIHARCLPAPDGAYPPHENMLMATFASMAVTAAGCNSLTIEGAVDTPLFRRWSTNVSNILRDESFFGRDPNPLAGAYAIETMSDAIARRAWEIFQQKVNAI